MNSFSILRLLFFFLISSCGGDEVTSLRSNVDQKSESSEKDSEKVGFDFTNGGRELKRDESLRPGQYLMSNDGEWKLALQTDGNFVRYKKKNDGGFAPHKVNGRDDAIGRASGANRLFIDGKKLRLTNSRGEVIRESSPLEGIILVYLENDGSLRKHPGGAIIEGFLPLSSHSGSNNGAGGSGGGNSGGGSSGGGSPSSGPSGGEGPMNFATPNWPQHPNNPRDTDLMVFHNNVWKHVSCSNGRLLVDKNIRQRWIREDRKYINIDTNEKLYCPEIPDDRLPEDFLRGAASSHCECSGGSENFHSRNKQQEEKVTEYNRNRGNRPGNQEVESCYPGDNILATMGANSEQLFYF